MLGYYFGPWAQAGTDAVASTVDHEVAKEKRDYAEAQRESTARLLNRYQRGGHFQATDIPGTNTTDAIGIGADAAKTLGAGSWIGTVGSIVGAANDLYRKREAQQQATTPPITGDNAPMTQYPQYGRQPQPMSPNRAQMGGGMDQRPGGAFSFSQGQGQPRQFGAPAMPQQAPYMARALQTEPGGGYGGQRAPQPLQQRPTGNSASGGGAGLTGSGKRGGFRGGMPGLTRSIIRQRMLQGLPDSILAQQQDAYMRSLIMQRQQMEANLARTGDQSAWAPAIQSGFENASALGNADMVRQFRQDQLDYPMNIAFQWRGSRKGANFQSPQRPGTDWGSVLGGIGSLAGSLGSFNWGGRNGTANQAPSQDVFYGGTSL